MKVAYPGNTPNVNLFRPILRRRAIRPGVQWISPGFAFDSLGAAVTLRAGNFGCL
jgi:hypothetical protein